MRFATWMSISHLSFSLATDSFKTLRLLRQSLVIGREGNTVELVEMGIREITNVLSLLFASSFSLLSCNKENGASVISLDFETAFQNQATIDTILK